MADQCKISVQINGKLCNTIVVDSDATKDTVLALAKSDPKVQQNIAGRVVRSELYFPKLMVNLVV